MGSLDEKKVIVAEIKEKIDQAQSVILADYRGLKVKEVTELRALLRKQGVELKVLKNTLVKIAADQAEVEGLDSYLNGNNMWAFSMADPTAAAKVLRDYAKTHPSLILKGGIIEKKAIDATGAVALADLPSREVLLAQVAGMLQGPIIGLVNVLQGPIRKMGYALEAVRAAKEA
ncbi:MAG TPA: 50S ribosomal protein L10 [Peptococcaceae bacterium]|nr:50S ribosomal protein L10 [Peptococcaceae bacterium]